jgi:hypothetical protein
VDEPVLTELGFLREIFPAGRRVRFLGFGEHEPVQLAVGSEGTIAVVDSMGTVHVEWDTGVRLGMIVRSPDCRRPDRVLPLGEGPMWSPR